MLAAACLGPGRRVASASPPCCLRPLRGGRTSRSLREDGTLALSNLSPSGHLRELRPCSRPSSGLRLGHLRPTSSAGLGDRPRAHRCHAGPRRKVAPLDGLDPRAPVARPPRGPRGPGLLGTAACGRRRPAGPRPKVAPLDGLAPRAAVARPPRGPRRRGCGRLNRRSAPLDEHLPGSRQSRSLRETNAPRALRHRAAWPRREGPTRAPLVGAAPSP